MRIIFALGITLLFSTCVSGQKETHNTPFENKPEEASGISDYISGLEEEIIGEWRNVSMKIKVNTYNHSDTSFIVDINEDNWDLKMTVKPIITTINEDGTYMSEFRNSFDSLIYQPRGTWLIDGDTLIMQDHQATYKYQIFIDGDRAEFRSLLDWDGDGAADDEYFGVQRKTQ